jgi:hypothetical protein
MPGLQVNEVDQKRGEGHPEQLIPIEKREPEKLGLQFVIEGNPRQAGTRREQ